MMRAREVHERHEKSWTSLAALLLILLFASAADGVMDALGLGWCLVIGLAIMGAAWGLVEVGGLQEGGSEE